MRERLRQNAPAITLLLLAPALGELLSGSAPPSEFFNPVALVLLAFLYGGGALLVRDAVRGRRKGYPSLLCLGAAYAIFEEGIVCKSFFDPNWPDLGALGTYGRWLGTNWAWLAMLTLYHTIVSIAVPILLVEVSFSARRSDKWLGTSWRNALLAVMGLWALLGYFVLSKFRPPWPHYLIAWATVFALIWLAPRLPVRLGLVPGPRRSRPAWLWAVGFLWTVLLFMTFWALPPTGIPPILTIFVGLALSVPAAFLVLRLSGDLGAWDDRGRFLLAAGVLSFFILLAPLQESDKTRSDNPRGMAAVGATALVLLLWQGRRVWKRTRVG